MYDIIIIGAGPSGLTAGIYAGRASLKTLILDTAYVGGTINTAPLIENYPGFSEISGRELAEHMAKQAEKYSKIKGYTKVNEIIKKDDGTFIIHTTDMDYESKYVIIATGSSKKMLENPYVNKYHGRGVSYCAVCDGTFFIGKDVLIIGGGNSAATQAIYLKKIGVNCSIVHRRDKLRCDKKLQEDINKLNISIYWNSTLENIKGSGHIEKAIILNTKTNHKTEVNTTGIFIAIGETPNSDIAIKSNIKCDELGYIITDKNMKTNVNGIYAAGDITGGIKQIIVASGEGAIATSKIQELI